MFGNTSGYLLGSGILSYVTCILSIVPMGNILRWALGLWLEEPGSQGIERMSDIWVVNYKKSGAQNSLEDVSVR